MNFLLDAIRSLDARVYQFANGYAGNWFLDRIASFEEEDNLLKGALFLTAYAYLWFETGGDRERRRRAIIAIFTGTMLSLVVARTIADIAPFRLRPMYDPGIPHRPYSVPVSHNMEDWSSFPSDTATYFFALAFGLAYLSPRYMAPTMLYTAVWICLPRLFLGEHYLSDLVIGAAIGISMAWAAVRSKWIESVLATRVLSSMHAKPGVFYAFAFLVCSEMSVLFGDIRFILRKAINAGLMAISPRASFSLLAIGVLIACFIAAGFAVVLAFRAGKSDAPRRSRTDDHTGE